MSGIGIGVLFLVALIVALFYLLPLVLLGRLIYPIEKWLKIAIQILSSLLQQLFLALLSTHWSVMRSWWASWGHTLRK